MPTPVPPPCGRGSIKEWRVPSPFGARCCCSERGNYLPWPLPVFTAKRLQRCVFSPFSCSSRPLGVFHDSFTLFHGHLALSDSHDKIVFPFVPDHQNAQLPGPICGHLEIKQPGKAHGATVPQLRWIVFYPRSRFSSSSILRLPALFGNCKQELREPSVWRC